MDWIQRVKLAMWVRVLGFVRAYPFGDGPADAVAARFMERVARHQALIAQQHDGMVQRTVQVKQVRAVRRRIVGLPLRHLAGVAAALEVEDPALAVAIAKRTHDCGAQEFLATVKSIIATIQTRHDELRSHGMAEDTLARLTGLVAEYEAALSEVDAARRAHTGARGEMRSVGRELSRLGRQLDGLVLYHHFDKPDLLGAWLSARDVAWPVRHGGQEATGDGATGDGVQPGSHAEVGILPFTRVAERA
jgi:hypothetical protein